MENQPLNQNGQYNMGTQQPVQPPFQPQYGLNMQQYVPQPPVFDKKAHRALFSRIGLSYFLFFVVTTAIQLAISVVIKITGSDILDNYLALILFSIIPMYLFAAPTTWLMMKKIPVSKPERTKWGTGAIIAGFFVTYFAMYIGNFIGVFLGTIIEELLPWARAATNEVQDLASEGDMLVNLVIMVFVGPVVEELLFRKLLIDRVRAYGELIAVLLSGIMFGLFHGNITQGTYATLIGLVLAFVYVKTGDIRITIGYHITINFIGGIIAVLVKRSVDLQGFLQATESGDASELMMYFAQNMGGAMIMLIYGMFAICAMIAGLALLIVALVMGKVKFAPGQIRLPRGMRFSTVAVNFGMIAFFAVCVIEIIMSFFS